uniref:Odorant receptor n=1 Tax=Conopomorpha sinensis TaxID=940481 RepID=A0A3Q8HDN8_9NEOP|nr:putative odorant receptor 28 [Conopomorpha sinensis]
MVASEARSCLSAALLHLRLAGFIRLGRKTGALRAAGGVKAHVRVPWQRPHGLYCVFSLVVTTTYLMQEILYAFKMRTDIGALAKVMFLLLCHVTSLAKQVVFYFDAGRIDDLIEYLDDPVFNRPGQFAAQHLKSRRVAATRLVRTYAGTALCTCAMWLAFPIYARATGQPVHFSVHVNVDYSTLPGFLIMMVYTNYVTALVAIANTSMDAFITTFLAQATTQLDILKHFLSRLTKDAVAEHKMTGEPLHEAFKRLLTFNLDHYNKINHVARSVQDIFGVAVLIQFAIGGWILCMAAYNIVMLDGGVVETVSMTLFIVCILTELFLYCYYGNELTYASKGVASSLYESGWERLPAGPRRLVLTSMTRARRDLAVTAARFVPLTLDSYIKILKSSYTIFALLRQTK